MEYFIFETKFSNRIASPKSKTISFEMYNSISSGKRNEKNVNMEFEINSGKELSLILNPASVGFYFMERSVVKRINEEKIRGVNFIPTLLKSKDKKTVNDQYCILSILCSSNELDYSKSVSLEKGMLKGVSVQLIDEIECDVFRPVNSLFIIVNEKFKRIVDGFNINNVLFTNLKNVTTPEFIARKT